MAIRSKYNNQQVEAILQDMVTVLEKHHAPTDLALMVLGNMTSYVLTHQVVGQDQQKQLAQAFSTALMNSIQFDKK